MTAGVYADCPDPSHRDPAKAIVLIQHALRLSLNPTYLTVLALAYFRSGDLEKAVAAQRQAVESPAFPSCYRDEATQQLHAYEAALAARRHQIPRPERCGWPRDASAGTMLFAQGVIHCVPRFVS